MFYLYQVDNLTLSIRRRNRAEPGGSLEHKRILTLYMSNLYELISYLNSNLFPNSSLHLTPNMAGPVIIIYFAWINFSHYKGTILKVVLTDVSNLKLYQIVLMSLALPPFVWKARQSMVLLFLSLFPLFPNRVRLIFLYFKNVLINSFIFEEI